MHEDPVPPPTDIDHSDAGRPQAVEAGVAVPTSALRPAHRARGAVGFLAVALLAATLASGGTYAALEASGALSHVTINSSLAGTPVGQVSGVGQTGVDSSSSVVDAAASASPAVVTIISSSPTSSIGQDDPFGGQDPFATPDPGNGNGGGQTPTGIGSGVIFDSNGWILTNHHVVQGATSLTVKLTDGRTFPAKVYGTDTLTDLAVLKVEIAGLPTAKLGDSAALKVGQLAIAIGNRSASTPTASPPGWSQG